MTDPADQPALHVELPDGAVHGLALVLHGGRVNSTEPTAERQLAVLRLRPVARELHRAGSPHGLAVARLRYRVRGWNGSIQSPVQDARWALERLQTRFPDLPIALIGHSMGGRVINHVAGETAVTTAVELAPWVEPGDPVDTLTARALLVVHGAQDRTTSPYRSAQLVEDVQGVASIARYVGLRRTAHAIIRRAGLAHDLTSAFVLDRLFGVEPSGPAGAILSATGVRALV